MEINVGVIGLGYVGLVTCASIASKGINVYGFDTDIAKVNDLNEGKVGIYEPGLTERLIAGVDSNTINFAADISVHLKLDVVFVCVGTPSKNDGSIDLSQVLAAGKSLNSYIKNTGCIPFVCLRSTAIPKTTDGVFADAVNNGLTSVAEVAFLPEFLREGSALNDFKNPARLVVGGSFQEANLQLLKRIFWRSEAELRVLSTVDAETIKYLDNNFHALKIVFANEVDRLCDAFGADSETLMKEFVHDTTLNLSPKYLMPGLPYGGSCLPKDVSALCALGEQMEVDLPLINAIRLSNMNHYRYLLSRLISRFPDEVKSLVICGFAFKENTGDTRNSPALEVLNEVTRRYPNIEVFFEDANVSENSVGGLGIKEYDGRSVDVAVILLSSQYNPSKIKAGNLYELY